MSLNKILGAAALTFWIGLVGCSREAGKSDLQYHFDGKLGADRVRFYEPKVPDHDKTCSHFGANVLEITRSDGVKIIYTDWTPDVKSDNLKVDEVKIIKSGVELVFNSQSITWQEMLPEAQKQFDNYLQKILDRKKDVEREGIDLLRTRSIFREGGEQNE